MNWLSSGRMLECVYFYADFTSTRYTMSEDAFNWTLKSLQMSSNNPMVMSNGDVVRLVVYDVSYRADEEILTWTIGHPVDWESPYVF